MYDMDIKVAVKLQQTKLIAISRYGGPPQNCGVQKVR
jgi:hypothetical protein